MTKTTTTKKTAPTYTATFTLSQEGMESEVKAQLLLEPEIDMDVIEKLEDLPFVFRAMTELAHIYLMGNGIMDEKGNMIVNTVDEGDGLRVVRDSPDNEGKVH